MKTKTSKIHKETMSINNKQQKNKNDTMKLITYFTQCGIVSGSASNGVAYSIRVQNEKIRSNPKSQYLVVLQYNGFQNPLNYSFLISILWNTITFHTNEPYNTMMKYLCYITKDNKGSILFDPIFMVIEYLINQN